MPVLMTYCNIHTT